MTLDAGRVQTVFLAVLEQEPLADRASILDRECAADEELRRRVEALLIAHDKSDNLLDRPFVAFGEQVVAMLPEPADTAEAFRPPPNDQEQMP
jgi:hypothetical protein